MPFDIKTAVTVKETDSGLVTSGFDLNTAVPISDADNIVKKQTLESEFKEPGLYALTPKREVKLRRLTPEEESILQERRNTRLLRETPDWAKGDLRLRAFAQGVLPIAPKEDLPPSLEKAFPIATATGKLAGTVMMFIPTLRTTAGIVPRIENIVPMAKELYPVMTKVIANVIHTGLSGAIVSGGRETIREISSDTLEVKKILGETVKGFATYAPWGVVPGTEIGAGSSAIIASLKRGGAAAGIVGASSLATEAIAKHKIDSEVLINAGISAVTAALLQGFRAKQVAEAYKSKRLNDFMDRQLFWQIKSRNPKLSDNEAKALSFITKHGLFNKPAIVEQVETNLKAQVKLGKPKVPTVKPLVKPGEAIKLPIAPELQPLAEEAKKFKTAEEFVKSKPTVFHGTGATFTQFDIALGGAITEAKSAKGAIFFVDNSDIAKNYAVFAAEEGPVIEALRKARELEEKAQIAQEKGQTEKANKLFGEADKFVIQSEELTESEATFKRRKTAVVKEVILVGDFLEIDAKGKTPQELSKEADIDSWLNEQIKIAKDQGKDGVIFKNLDDTISLEAPPANHYAVFSKKSIKTKQQLTELYNQVTGKVEPEITPEEIKEVKKITTIDSLKEKLNTLETEEKERAFLKRIVRLGKKENIPEETISAAEEQLETITQGTKTQKETVILKNKIRDIQRGMREGTLATKEEIKATQKSAIDLFTQAKMDIPVSIKSIQTPEQFNKALPDILRRIATFEERVKVTRLNKKIKKELKTSKPLKKGQRYIGKYDYENNKLFETLRKYSKLTKEKALIELNSYPKEPTSEVDLIKKRFLSLRANGLAASADAFQQVYNDILKMKEIGKSAKDEADFIKAIERQERVEEVLETVKKSLANKDTVKTKIGNSYRVTVADIWSMLNSITDKNIADKYNPEISEQDRDVAIWEKSDEINNTISKMYDNRKITDILFEMFKEDYEITDKNGLTNKISRRGIMDIYLSIKNPAIKARYDYHFGEAYIQTLIAKLNIEDLFFADYLQEEVQKYREVFNQRSIEVTGRDNGFVENYWPATSVRQEDIYDDIKIQGETASPMKQRARGLVKPRPVDAYSKAMKHIAMGEHVANLSRKYETLKRLFTNEAVENAIRNKFGNSVYSTLLKQIDRISLNAETANIDAITNVFGKALNNWVIAKIAFNPSTYVRQLISMGNYMENMNPEEWGKYFFEGISNPKETFDFMWKNDPTLKARFNRGYSEALTNAISGAEKLSAGWSDWTKFLNYLARQGDITAIIYGGYPLVKSELAAGKGMEKTILKFRETTLRAQQSPLVSSRSEFQNSKNPLARFFFAFKNTSFQYARKIADAIISYQNGDISIEQLTKTLTIYGVIQPILFALAGIAVVEGAKAGGRFLLGTQNETKDLEDKIIAKVITAIIVNPINAIPVLSDITKNVVARKLTGQKAYKAISLPVIEDINRAIGKMNKKKITAGDYLKAVAVPVEISTAFPLQSIIRYYEYFTKEEKTKKGR